MTMNVNNMNANTDDTIRTIIRILFDLSVGGDVGLLSCNRH